MKNQEKIGNISLKKSKTNPNFMQDYQTKKHVKLTITKTYYIQ